MDLARAIVGPDLLPGPVDRYDRNRVQTRAGRARALVTSATFAPVDGVRLCDWWADRCRVDLFGLGSVAGATLRLQLVAANVDTPDASVVVIDRGVIVPAGSKGSPLSLTLGIASGWLALYWVLLAHVGVGEEVEFSARYTLDHAGAGLYTAPGDGTIP